MCSLQKLSVFYFLPDKAPVSKGLMGSMFLTCTAMNMPLLAHMRKYLVCKLPDIFKEGEVRYIEMMGVYIIIESRTVI